MQKPRERVGAAQSRLALSSVKVEGQSGRCWGKGSPLDGDVPAASTDQSRLISRSHSCATNDPSPRPNRFPNDTRSKLHQRLGAVRRS